MLTPFASNEVHPSICFPLSDPTETQLLGNRLATTWANRQFGHCINLLHKEPEGVRNETQALLLAAAYFHTGMLNEAEDILVTNKFGDASLPMVYIGHARIALEQSRLPDAVAFVEQALQHQPHSIEGTYLFGRLCLLLGEAATACQIPVLLQSLGAPASLIQAFSSFGVTAQSSEAPFQSTRPPRTWASDEVVIYCGRANQSWSPRSLEHGIGGSEEAVIRLARQLHTLGWRVTVYNDVGEDAGDYDGVTYHPLAAYNPRDQFNIYISWRTLGCFDTALDAAHTYLWLHDVPNSQHFSKSRLNRIDTIIVLSDFHRACLSEVPATKFWISGNGLDLADLEGILQHAPIRNPYRCIYASSYSRGLELLLTIWPQIKEAVPEAELHVFYGWESFSSQADDPSFQRWKAHMDALLAQPGVIHHGRVGHAQIWEETLKSGIWAYPSTYPETSCITAMKAQAAGAIPVVFGYAALTETVQHGAILPTTNSGDPTPAQRVAYTKALIAALTNHVWQADVRAEMMPWAREAFSWQQIAQTWSDHFSSVRPQRRAA